MKTDNSEILSILHKVNPSIKCPSCNKTFPAKKAGLFDIRDQRLPKPIKSIINGEFSSIRLENNKIGRKAKELDKKRAALKVKRSALEKKRKERPKRVKIIRNALVHSSDRYERKERYIPTASAESEIRKEIPLMKYLAERVIIGSAK